MNKISYLIIFIFILSNTSYSQIVDSTSTKNISKSKDKKERYDATQYLDTLVVNDKQIIETKKKLKSNFSKHTKHAGSFVLYNGDSLTTKKARQLIIKNNRDSIRAYKNIWASVLGGPSYTPESSFGLGGAVLMSFKFNPNDTTVTRSNLPFGFLASTNGSFMLAGAGQFYLNSNKIQIYTRYGIRYEPVNYFGVGFGTIDKNHKSDSTTQYTSLEIEFRPTVSFKITDKILLGPLLDYNYYQFEDVNPIMAKDPDYLKFGDKYLVAGLGVNFRYDTRDNHTMPYDGMRLDFTSTVYGKWLGSVSNFTYTSIDYRYYKRLFERRSVLASTARIDFSTGDVPFTELPSFGSPFDLRGYTKGHYRDRSMGYVMTEYRHMLGSQEIYDNFRPFYSRLGFAVWGAVASMGPNLGGWNQAKWNFGAGIRYEIQPNTNFRLDIGKSPNGDTMVYMNMTEAF